MNFPHVSFIVLGKPMKVEKPVDNLCAKNAQIVDLLTLSVTLSERRIECVF